jgi:5'-nucleotidase
MHTSEQTILLAVDMDGVLADLSGSALHIMSQRHDLAHLVTAQTYYELKNPVFKLNFPLEYQDEIDRIIRAPGFVRELKPIPGALEALESLVAAGIHPWILTSPLGNDPTIGQIEKSAWLSKHVYPRIGYENISGVLYTNQKEKLKFDYVIEDRPHKYYPLYLQGKLPWTLITLAQPWNEEDPNPLRISWLPDGHPQRYLLRRPGMYYKDVFKALGITTR